MLIHEIFEDTHLPVNTKSKWSTNPEDLFKGPVETLVDYVKAGSKNLQQALSKLSKIAVLAKTPQEKTKLQAAEKQIQASF